MIPDPRPLDRFVETLESLTSYIQLNMPDYARRAARQLKRSARRLADDPEFAGLFREKLQACKYEDPERAMHCVQAFLNSLAEAGRRSHAGVPQF